MPPDPFDLVGDVLDGQFRVESFAGEGDLSVVYKGHHLGVDAPVAIKFLNLPETLDPALAYPLVLGFQEASRVHYRLARGTLHVAQTIASGSTLVPRTGAVVPYLVREWFEGESLASDLARRRNEKREGRTIDETLALLETAFDAITYAHAQGEVHLSMNPSNLFLARREGASAPSVKVLDFGVARAVSALGSGASSASGPATGLHLLSPAYAAPEQLERTAGKLGPWTDVYALALVTMEVLSDRVVMGGSETGVLVERALDARQRPTPQSHGLKLPSHVDRALARAVERAPDGRQQSAGELWRDLKHEVQTIPLPWAPAPAPRLSRPALSRPLPRSMQPLAEPGPVPPPGAVSVEMLPLSFERNIAPPIVGPLVVKMETEAVPVAVSAIADVVPPPLVGALAGSPIAVQTWGSRVRQSTMWWLRAAVAAVADRFVVLRAHCRSLVARQVSGAAFLGAIDAVCLLLVALPWRPSASHATSAAVTISVPTPAAAAAPPAPMQEPPAAFPSEPAPVGRFGTYAALLELDRKWQDVARCRRGKVWGKTWTTVTFANDGSVSAVTVGPPFVGTPTAQCIADNLIAVRVTPFGDGPRAIAYRVYVAPR